MERQPGVFTVSSEGGDRVSQVQQWGRPLDARPNRALAALTARMDAFNPDGLGPLPGVQFRVLCRPESSTPRYLSPRAQRREVALAVDISPPFDRLPPRALNAPALLQPLSGQALIGLLADYTAYVQERFPEETRADRLTIEVLPFQAYRIDREDPEFNLATAPARLQRMANTPMRLAQERPGETEDYYTGYNYAVVGHKQLSVIHPGTIARLSLHGTAGPLQTLLRAVDGRQVRLHPDLMVPRPGRVPQVSTDRLDDLALSADPFSPEGGMGQPRRLPPGR
jgi:hypothetical protein